MKQSVENQIKEAFEAWDEEKTEVGFDKAALWTSMNENKLKPIIFFSWYKVASVAIILLLSGALAFSFQAQCDLQCQNQQLVLSLNQTKQTNKPVIEKQIEEKIVYQTQIKEVESASARKAFADLAFQYENLKKENVLLKKDLNQFDSQFAYLSDSLKSLEGNWARIEKGYAMELQQLKASSQSNGLSIDIDEEALLALANEMPKQENKNQEPTKRLTLKFRNSSSNSETSAPLFRDIDSK
ncbi:hypothetical protein ACXR6G_15455 [Ancylomarina sp. YFZ004]